MVALPAWSPPGTALHTQAGAVEAATPRSRPSPPSPFARFLSPHLFLQTHPSTSASTSILTMDMVHASRRLDITASSRACPARALSVRPGCRSLPPVGSCRDCYRPSVPFPLPLQGPLPSSIPRYSLTSADMAPPADLLSSSHPRNATGWG